MRDKFYLTNNLYIDKSTVNMLLSRKLKKTIRKSLVHEKIGVYTYCLDSFL